MIKLEDLYGKYKELLCSHSTHKTVKRLWVSVEINNKVPTTSFIVSSKSKEDIIFHDLSDALETYNNL